MVEQLAKENRAMPKDCIMDLVKMYNKMTPEQRDKFDEEMEKLVPQPMENLVDDEIDGTSVLHFVDSKEADDYLRNEGKLVDDGNLDE